jgi:5'-nucleotidase/UDP-sugar diphosphatase
MKKITTLVTGIFFLLFAATGFSGQKPSVVSTEIIILHTNDMHSKIDNLPKLAYLLDSLRVTHPIVLLVAAGDNFTGNPVVDMVADKGFPMVDLMNQCGFQVTAIGNHEFDMGQEMLNYRMDQAQFPFISCNIRVVGAILRQPQPFMNMVAGKDISIAFLSAIELNDRGIPDTHPSRVTGLAFSDPIKKMKEFAWLKDKYTILVGLTHFGVETDLRLADSMPQLDLIIGGHSHTLIDPPLIENGVMVVQAGANLKYIGKTTLTVENGKLTGRKDEIITVSALKGINPKVQTSVDNYNLNEAFSQVVGYAEAPLEGYDEIGSLMTDALKKQLKVDYAFQNCGGIRVQNISAGNITLKDVYQLDPFNNQVVIFKMNLAEITSLICNAFNLEKTIDLMVSGLKYTVTTNPDGTCASVEITDKEGKPLNPAKDYTVAMNSYMAASYRFDHRDPGTTAAATSVQILIEYLDAVKNVNYTGVKRTFLNPVK